MSIVVASTHDVDPAVRVLVDAFADDALIKFLFRSHPRGVATGAHDFFSILMRARIALAMPTILLKEGDRIVGSAMGYDTDPPPWPEAFNEEWRRLAADTPGFAERLSAYETIASRHVPAEPHYYLGVLGVQPAAQGKGYGQALLDAVCDLSAADSRSRGVYLETSSPRSLQFYYRHGFQLQGQSKLDGDPLWCVFKRT